MFSERLECPIFRMFLFKCLFGFVNINETFHFVIFQTLLECYF